ncbi:pyridoxal phosphate-dependent aminotransferase [Pseudonocardia sp. TRM90224]|uniref:pyridoxal phosphate-dependent aminotransferase n=1 Tax=Pseudonocardia sp. TRM90224 TaxID=2812678 RepID=UPI001E3B276D|nr:pyridoxal phosphate-dependent aminotransferase [Pseudonocardia sp. TRM90224]
MRASRIRTSQRLAGIGGSATYAVHDLVQSMRAEGKAVLDLGGGDPDFPTAEHIAAAAADSVHAGFTHYTPSRGLPELRTAISEKLLDDNRISTDPGTDVIVTPSAKYALFLALTTILDPGDDILIPTPSWVSYASMAHLVGARPVSVPLRADGGFRLTRKLLDAAVGPRTRAILINTPNNPTGHVLDEQEATDLAAFAIEHDLAIVADEIYEKIIYRGRHISMAAVPGCAERTLTVNGFSKAYAMTGWRLGYIAGPTDVITEVLKAAQHTVGCAGSFVQQGGIAALTGPQGDLLRMVDEYAARRTMIVEGLAALPGVTCTPPDGAFYAFADISGAGRGSDTEFAEWLLTTAGVAVTPGSAFGEGGEGHVRLSFSGPQDVIKEALERIADAFR